MTHCQRPLPWQWQAHNYHLIIRVNGCAKWSIRWGIPCILLASLVPFLMQYNWAVPSPIFISHWQVVRGFPIPAKATNPARLWTFPSLSADHPLYIIPQWCTSAPTYYPFTPVDSWLQPMTFPCSDTPSHGQILCSCTYGFISIIYSLLYHFTYLSLLYPHSYLYPHPSSNPHSFLFGSPASLIRSAHSHPDTGKKTYSD